MASPQDITLNAISFNKLLENVDKMLSTFTPARYPRASYEV